MPNFNDKKWEIFLRLLGTRNYVDLAPIEQKQLDVEVERIYKLYSNGNVSEDSGSTGPQLLNEGKHERNTWIVSKDSE